MTLDDKAVARLRDLVPTSAVKGEMAKRVIEYLLSMVGVLERICAQDISDNGGPQGDANVRPFMSRMRDQIADFFDYHAIGRKEAWRIVFPTDDRGNYAIQFAVNKPPDNLVPAFWSPHFMNALTVYPEMQLSNGSMPDCSPTRFPSNVIPIRPLSDSPTFDFPHDNAVVSASVVRSILRLKDCFLIWQVRVRATGVTRLVDMLDGGDLIVLATPGTMPFLLPNLEAAGRMKTAPDGVLVIGDAKDAAKGYSDTAVNGQTEGAYEMVKWGVLTRHRYRYQRTLTVLAARDEAAVEAMVHFLINEEAMLRLARALRCGEAFPDHFQALFRMHVFKGHPYAYEMTVEQAIDLGANGKASSPSKKSA